MKAFIQAFCYPVLLLFALGLAKPIQTYSQQSVIDSLRVQVDNTQDSAKVLTMLRLAARLRLNDVDESIQLSKKSLELSENLEYKSGMGSSLREIGIAFSNQNEFDSAKYYLMRALNIYEELGDKKKLCHINTSLGILYRRMGRYTEAAESYLESMRYAEELDYTTGIALISHNLATVYHQGQKEYDKALPYYRLSHKVAKEVKNDPLVAASLHNIGLILHELGELDSALIYLQNSLLIVDKGGYNLSRAFTHRALGILKMDLGRYYDAIDNYKISIQLFDEQRNSDHSGNSEIRLAIAYAKTQNIGLSKAAILNGLEKIEVENRKSTIKIPMNLPLVITKL